MMILDSTQCTRRILYIFIYTSHPVIFFDVFLQTGVVLTGLPAYQRLFATFRFFRQVLVHDVSTVFRLSYDGSRQQVRSQLRYLSWEKKLPFMMVLSSWEESNFPFLGVHVPFRTLGKRQS